MDLSKNFPRSPFDMLAGLVMLPRTTDKARARRQGSLGDYLYNCPLDQELFAFLGIDAEDFAGIVEKVGDDAALAGWVEQHCPRQDHEKEAFNNRLRHLRPEGEEGRRWLEEKYEALGRRDFATYFDQLDADEGRF